MVMPQRRERVLPRLIEEEMRDSFLDYSMSVIVQRALPDVRDGLKPVHRRILYAMSDLGLNPGRPYKKSASVVGEVLGKYHPHGDSAVYDAMVRMVQDFSLRYPLVDGQGNFGSIDGDNPAAMRYTEAKLRPLAMELLDEIKKQTVDFRPNYDGTLFEPVVLPAKVPNLLVNGAAGIAVGMATNIPPHNLREVCEAARHLIDNPACTVSDLMRFVRAPDFPTGGYICGTGGARRAYETGRGRVVMRARIHQEEIRGHADYPVETLMERCHSRLQAFDGSISAPEGGGPAFFWRAHRAFAGVKARKRIAGVPGLTGKGVARAGQSFTGGVLGARGADPARFGQPCKDCGAGGVRVLGAQIGPARLRALGQGDEQGDLVRGELIGFAAEPGPARRAHPLQIAAIGRQGEVEFQYLPLGQPRLQLQGAKRFDELGPQIAPARLQ